MCQLYIDSKTFYVAMRIVKIKFYYRKKTEFGLKRKIGTLYNINR